MVGSLALVALPFTTGFYSKDYILQTAFGTTGYLMGLAAAYFTALFKGDAQAKTWLQNSARYWPTHARLQLTVSTVYLALAVDPNVANRVSNDVAFIDAMARLVVSSNGAAALADRINSRKLGIASKKESALAVSIFVDLKNSMKNLILPLMANSATYKAAYPLVDTIAPGIKLRESPVLEAVQFSRGVINELGQETKIPHDLLSLIYVDTSYLEALLVQGLGSIDEMADPLRRNQRVLRKQTPDRCDFCDRTAIEAGTPDGRLKRCGRCKVAVYCSTDCSKKAWKERHRAVCFEAGK